ncbi:ComF family protein [Dysgonomonas sp. PH5-45]|uniref:ComF family protein n=1 Tax=unclassified Dysgonomonas TaxID=2630389 RepID=UPI002475CCCD|nr:MULTISPECIES: ComF family protein [unclassified Dysgonomonas]MDH6354160.1 ComF family protein [Dysgonomonas sp. PH5-45]MDH6386989.1 ComF family protein [Dysgonomonas sp. PH5-37]
MKIAKNIFSGLLDLFFPSVCVACSRKLVEGEAFLCLECLAGLPKTNFCHQPQNPVEQIFAGRFPFLNAASFFHFSKGGGLQQILHELKYKDNGPIGIWLGELCGNELKKSGFMKPIDVIVPVPLHPKRQRKRGYNQCLRIAKGLSHATGIDVCDDAVKRVIDNKSQTKKSRLARFENVSGIFHLEHPTLLENRHVLLVDDLITTGATMDECARTVLRAEGARISIFAIGSAL